MGFPCFSPRTPLKKQRRSGMRRGLKKGASASFLTIFDAHIGSAKTDPVQFKWGFGEQGARQKGDTKWEKPASAKICGFLRFPAKICENPAVSCANLRLPNPLIYRAVSKNLRKWQFLPFAVSLLAHPETRSNLNRGFRRRTFERQTCLFRGVYKNPIPEEKAACKMPIFYKHKGPCLERPLNWTGSIFPLLTKSQIGTAAMSNRSDLKSQSASEIATKIASK